MTVTLSLALSLAAALALGWLVAAPALRLANAALARWGEGQPRPMAPGYRRTFQAASAIASAGLWQHYGLSLALLPAAASVLLLLMIAANDLDQRLVLNELLFVGVVLGLLRAAPGGLPAVLSAIAGGCLGFGLFLIASLLSRGALGAGDVKLAGLLGLVVSYPAILQALFLGVLAGGLTAGFLILTRRMDRRSAIPYAPFLAVGGILGLLM